MLRTPEIFIERGYLRTEFYKRTEMEPVAVRRAKALENFLNKMTINVEDDELIVGSATSKVKGGPLLPEFQWKWYLDVMFGFTNRYAQCARRMAKRKSMSKGEKN